MNGWLPRWRDRGSHRSGKRELRVRSIRTGQLMTQKDDRRTYVTAEEQNLKMIRQLADTQPNLGTDIDNPIQRFTGQRIRLLWHLLLDGGDG